MSITDNDAIETGVVDTDVKSLLTEILIKDEHNEVFIEEYEQFNKNEVKTEVDLVPTQFKITVDRKNESEDINSDDDNVLVGIEDFEQDKISHTESKEVDDSQSEDFEDRIENSSMEQSYSVAINKNENSKVINIFELEDKVTNEVSKDYEKIVTSDVNKSPKILMSLLAKKDRAKTTDGMMVRKIEAKRNAMDKPGSAKR